MKKTQFITHAAKEEAGRMINGHLYGNQLRERWGQQWVSGGNEHEKYPLNKLNSPMASRL